MVFRVEVVMKSGIVRGRSGAGGCDAGADVVVVVVVGSVLLMGSASISWNFRAMNRQ